MKNYIMLNCLATSVALAGETLPFNFNETTPVFSEDPVVVIGERDRLVSPNFINTNTVADGSWIRTSFQTALSDDGSQLGHDFQEDPQYFDDISTFTIEGEYAVNDRLSIIGEVGFADALNSDFYVSEDGLTAPEIGLKYNVLETENYTGTVYAKYISNSAAEYIYDASQDDSYVVGFVQNYVLEEKGLSFTLDANFSTSSREREILSSTSASTFEEDNAVVNVSLGAYKTISSKLGLGVELSYQFVGTEDFSLNTTNPSISLIEDPEDSTHYLTCSVFADYALTDALDFTLGATFTSSTGRPNSTHSDVTSASGHVGLTYNF